MVHYLDTNQIKDNKEYLKIALNSKSSYFIRDGKILEIVKNNIPGGSKILEIGPGKGDFLKQLNELGYSVSAVDVDDYLEDLVKKNFNFAVADLNTRPLPFEDEEFDCLVAAAVIEHLENGAYFLKESKRVLKKGGLLILSMPNVFSFSSRVIFFFRGEIPSYSKENNHITIFTKSILIKLTSGLRLEKDFYSRGFIKIFGKKIWLPDMYFINKHFGSKVCYQFKKYV
ncbi:class I SAM-dependent methyltransferase [Patescibacteria group bacterium]|nr:class I SAM-dependent methyltransferase [Patescibacteria group bacterium]